MEKPISFDYKTIKVKRTMEAITADTYQALGWELSSTTIADRGLFYVNLSFKRDRNIANKSQLLKLQEKAEYSLLNIEKIFSKQKTAGVNAGVALGTTGTLVFGGGMSMVLLLEGVGYIVGGIALGVVGIGLAAIGFASYKKIRSKKRGQLEQILNDEYNNIAEICEHAHKIKNA